MSEEVTICTKGYEPRTRDVGPGEVHGIGRTERSFPKARTAKVARSQVGLGAHKM